MTDDDMIPRSEALAMVAAARKASSDCLRQHASAFPVGHENRERGASSYNWFRHAADVLDSYTPADALAALDRKLEEARLEAIPIAASLAAAISLLEQGGKEAAASDKMFDQMLADYRQALEDYRAAIRAADTQEGV